MVHQVFLLGSAIVLLGHAWLASNAGLRLAGKSLMVVLGMWLLGLLGVALFFGVAGVFGFGDQAPPDGLAYTIIVLSLAVCIEDAIRTWFVASQVRKRISIAKSSLAFAVTISLAEMMVQTSELFTAAGYRALQLPMNGGAASFETFFSSYSLPLAVVGLNALRPGIHFLLCLSLFYAWQGRRWTVYAAVIAFHAALDVVLDLLAERGPVNYPVLALGIVFLFGLGLAAVTLWLRSNAERHQP